jgi:hypothetical protein
VLHELLSQVLNVYIPDESGVKEYQLSSKGAQNDPYDKALGLVQCIPAGQLSATIS